MFVKPGIVLLLIGQDLVSDEERVPARLSVTSPLRKVALVSPPSIHSKEKECLIYWDSPAPVCAPQRHRITIQEHFLSLQTLFIYPLSGRQWMQALTDKQSYDAAFMSGLDFFLLHSWTSPEYLSHLSVHSPQPWALLTQKSVTSHMGECRTCWRPLLFMRRCDPLCHPLSARGVCLHHCSLCSLYQPRVANEKHQVNTTTGTTMTLNLLIHLDTVNWNPCELLFGNHPFSCKPQLNAVCWNFTEWRQD